MFAILADEADSLLIDEAATPLLIAGAAPPVSQEKQDAYQWAAKYAPDCEEGVHYHYNKNDKQAELNSFGKQWVHKRLPKLNQQQPNQQQSESQLSLIDYYDYIERGINVERDLLRGRNYIIDDSEVLLVDAIQRRPDVVVDHGSGLCRVGRPTGGSAQLRFGRQSSGLYRQSHSVLAD